MIPREMGHNDSFYQVPNYLLRLECHYFPEKEVQFYLEFINNL